MKTKVHFLVQLTIAIVIAEKIMHGLDRRWWQRVLAYFYSRKRNLIHKLDE